MSRGKARSSNSKKHSTTIRNAILPDSPLHPSIVDGLGALKAEHKTLIDSAIRKYFDDILDIDEAFRVGHEQENRWDYLLGYKPSKAVVALEPHSAKDDEVSTVIQKRRAALLQLNGHLDPKAKVSRWLWVVSKKVAFADTEKIRRSLDQNGITFVGKMVQVKHLK